MKGIIYAALIFCAGLFFGWYLNQSATHTAGTSPAILGAKNATTPSAPVLVSEVPKMSTQEANSVRAGSYMEMETMEDVIQLPTDFSQGEALHYMAGRADEAELQSLIIQATGYLNRNDRAAALSILFNRYTELNPPGALEFLENLGLDIENRMYSSIFYSWSKVDLSMAIDKANSYGNGKYRRIAGEGILRAVSEGFPESLDSVVEQLEGNHSLFQHQARVLAQEATHSPQMAMEKALGLGGMQARHSAIYQIATVWARTDPESALTYSENILDVNLKNQYMHFVLRRWVSDEPEIAVARIETLPESPFRDRLLGDTLGNLARQDHETALKLAESFQGIGDKHEIYRNVFVYWSQTDPRGALEAAIKITDPTLSKAMIQQAGQQFAMQNPEEALLWAEGQNDEIRLSLVQTALGQMAQNDPRKAMSYLSSLSSPQMRENAVFSILPNLARRDPMMAAGFVSEMPSGQNKNSAIGQIVSAWSEEDPESAIDWLESLDYQSAQSALTSMADTVARRNPDRAATLLSRIPGEARSNWLMAISNSYSRTNPEKAINFLEDFKNEPGYEASLSAVLPRIAQTDPRRAIRMSQGLSPEYDHVLNNVIQTWAYTDLHSAKNWLRNAEASVQEKAIPGLVEAWTGYDYRAAKTWTLGLPASQAKDQALMSLLSNAPNDQIAREIFNGLSESANRDRATMAMFYRYMGRNRSAARQFLDSVEVSDETRAKMEQMFNR